MSLTIKTDRKWKHFKYRNEVPAKVLTRQFDWLKEEDGGFDGFILYRKCWYHVSMFMRFRDNSDSEFKGWEGYHGDSYFSGVVIELSKDGEMYRVGTYIE